MRLPSKRWRVLAGVAIVAGGVAACAPLLGPVMPAVTSPNAQQAAGNPRVAPPSEANPVPADAQAAAAIAQATPATAAAVTSPLRTAVVKRGPITDTVLLNGRVAGVQEQALSFTTRGTVDKVNVRPGDAVTAGQVLVEADSAQISKDLAAAQSRLVISTARLQQAQAQARARKDAAIAAAQDAAQRAEADLAKVQAGASTAERLAADGAVLSAQAALDRAKTNLATLLTPPPDDDVQAAEEQVALARLTLKSAQADLAKLKAGPDPAALRAAQRAVTDAMATQQAAQKANDSLTQGPDQYQLRAAQRAVEQAQAGLKAAQSTPSGTAGAPSGPAREAAITSAQLALANAQDQLDKLRQPPTQEEVNLARRHLDDARAAVAGAQEQLATLQQGPGQLALDQAQSAVDVAQMKVKVAETNLQKLKTGPSADAVGTAQTAVDGAQLTLNSATARQAEIYSHPTPDETRSALARVSAAHDALAKAQNARPEQDNPADMLSLQKSVDDDSKQVGDLKAALEATLLRAPTDGVVAQVQAQVGAAIDPSVPSVTLAGSPNLAVRVNLLDSQKPSPVAPGQKATVQVSGLDGTSFDAQVLSISDATASGEHLADLRVDWKGNRPTAGDVARVSIAVQEKTNVLLVPRRAVQTAGARRFVQYLDGQTPNSVDVELGISTPTDVEVLSGLQEGQTVVLAD